MLGNRASILLQSRTHLQHIPTLQESLAFSLSSHPLVASVPLLTQPICSLVPAGAADFQVSVLDGTNWAGHHEKRQMLWFERKITA